MAEGRGGGREGRKEGYRREGMRGVEGRWKGGVGDVQEKGRTMCNADTTTTLRTTPNAQLSSTCHTLQILKYTTGLREAC